MRDTCSQNKIHTHTHTHTHTPKCWSRTSYSFRLSVRRSEPRAGPTHNVQGMACHRSPSRWTKESPCQQTARLLGSPPGKSYDHRSPSGGRSSTRRRKPHVLRSPFLRCPIFGRRPRHRGAGWIAGLSHIWATVAARWSSANCTCVAVIITSRCWCWQERRGCADHGGGAVLVAVQWARWSQCSRS